VARDLCDLQREPTITRAQIDHIHAELQAHTNEQAGRIGPQRLPPAGDRHFRAFKESARFVRHASRLIHRSSTKRALATADVASGDWRARARLALRTIIGQADAERSVRVMLLSDIHAIFADRGLERIASAELVAALISIEERPWAEWRAGKPITANGLARLLAPFAIAPATIRTSVGTPKGYQRTQFEDAFSRYLPPGEGFKPPQRHKCDG
jgi:hypothetical protein